MFKDEFKAVVNGGVGKVNFLKNNPLGYFVAAMVAMLDEEEDAPREEGYEE